MERARLRGQRPGRCVDGETARFGFPRKGKKRRRRDFAPEACGRSAAGWPEGNIGGFWVAGRTGGGALMIIRVQSGTAPKG
ncbi:hypothetical protein BO83DRAFT_382558 [Aspergillus eucalypticola CBS 122712]|uniref:Uncharacterized protein n=1 Tax=Aspergillus eucalypticola (strain CBS 122712 / IBT 29274) TaxID=1448314 RepID=A0A317UPI6_ASPEC|nr:uncharacterized protein BO83DRAFT_382558 [Aspergillus eucalypticola CBS 122712]PWY63445.1 hypothetical protein BO83DRAFT_382558 [Aspergillus eucalypticola CBS 122712]